MRQAYLSSLVTLLTESKQGQHDKVQTVDLRKELAAKYEKSLFSAITLFMGRDVTLPPLPLQPADDDMPRDGAKSQEVLRADSMDYEEDLAFIKLALNDGRNRFDEYEKERLERENEERLRNEEQNKKTGPRKTNARPSVPSTGSLGGWSKQL